MAGEARSETGRRAFVGLLIAALVSCGFAVGQSAQDISAFVKARDWTAAGETSRTFALRGDDFFTVDRCVMYTYYGKGLQVKDALQADAWKTSWKNAGWKPVVLDERHAQIHPRYAALKRAYQSLPLGDTPSKRLEAESSLLRYLALAAVGGGYMTEPDVFNVNVPPPPKCDWVPNGGQFTTHDVFIPAMVTCDAASCLHVAEAFATAPPKDVKHATGAAYVSDVVFFSYFYQYDGVIKTRKSGFNDPTKVRDPPCDANGREVTPLMFHASPMARARWAAQDEANVGENEALIHKAATAESPNAKAKRSSKTSASKKENRAIVDPYAVREGRDGSVDSMTAAFHAMHTKPVGNSDTSTVAQIMHDRYSALRASTMEKCDPATFDGTREYVQTFFPEKPTPLQRSYNQEYLCDVSAAETFCDASAEEIEAGFEGIRAKGDTKSRKSGESKTKKSPRGEDAGAAAAATSASNKAETSMPRVHTGKVAKSDRLLIRYIDAGA